MTCFLVFFFLMIRRPPRSTRTDTLFPYTTLFRSSRFMSKSKIEGSFVATVTPFDRQGAIDFGAWRTLIDHQHRHGTRAILFLGSTDEPTLLSPEEKKQIIVETVKLRQPGMAFFYGCPGASTDQVIDHVRFDHDTGHRSE